MIVIDSLDIVSITFSTTYVGVLSGLTIVIKNPSTNISSTKTFTSILQSNSRYIELGIDWVNELANGNMYYHLYGDGVDLDEGIFRVSLPIQDFPYYKTDMQEYVIYKN